MKKHLLTFLTIAGLALLCSLPASGQKKKIDLGQALKGYFTPVTETVATPDKDGFVRRWLLLEPVSKPNRTNRNFTDSYTRDIIYHEYFPGQFTAVPKDGDKVKALVESQPAVNLQAGRPAATEQTGPVYEKATLQWHALDSDKFNVKLFRFATGLDKVRYGVIFYVYTVIECEEDIENVRMSVGSNSVSMWWVDGEEVLMINADRHMNVDGALTKRMTLHAGRNVIRGAVANGPGMSEFCLRFLDENGQPVRNYTVTTK